MSTAAKVARVPRAVRARARRVANGMLARMEERFDDVDAPLPHQPIIIVGPPRSGTTLLYQLMVERFDVGYLSNAHCRWFGGPSLLERRRRPLHHRAPADFTSQHGDTSGATSPSECGEYWYRFFPRDRHHANRHDTPAPALRRLRASMHALTRAFDRPVVFKNVLCTLRMDAIGAALPEARFLVLQRDLVANAQSILLARKRVHGSFDQWWSAQPEGFETLLDLPPEQQVVTQVRWMQTAVASAAWTLGPHGRCRHVPYEELCASPREVLDDIASFIAGHGPPLAVRAEVPPSFDRPAGARLEADMYARLERHASTA